MGTNKKIQLRGEALAVCHDCRDQDRRPTKDELKVLLAAYWESLLPSAWAQWVEDGCPPIV